MRRSDFDYFLPPELIAQAPLAERSASRLLVVDEGGGYADRAMRELPRLLRAGDLLVFNDTRVIPARLYGRKTTGGQVEILLERPLTASRALVQMRSSKGFRPGQVIHTAGGLLRVIAPHEDLWEIELPEAALSFFECHGAVPLPPYISRIAEAGDRERYQSVLARVPGAVAAPTASLHFDAALLAALEQAGVARATITLHVGAGTFQPVRTEQLDAHRMHAEWFDVPAATCAAVADARSRGGRVVAVGTTVARALESATGQSGLQPIAGDTQLFIMPGFRFRTIDGLLTNFHLPQSTLLMLVTAFAGHEVMMAAYRHAVAERYRFFSYGDAMLIWPPAESPQ